MVYGIVNIRTKKRARLSSGKLSGVYEYPCQAMKDIELLFSDSPYLTVKKLEGN